MKFALGFLLCLPLQAQAPPPQAPQTQPARRQPPQNAAPTYKPEELCNLEGVVRNSVTGEPLRKAELLLMRTDVRTPQQAQPSVTSSNAEGKFAMHNVEPGQYRLSVSRPGYVRTEYGARAGSRMGTALTLQKGESLKLQDFKLIPHAVVTGRILDDDGDPVQSSQVLLLRYTYAQGRKQLVPFSSASTNDLGEYRIFGVAPGKYYLSANVNIMGPASFGVDRSVGAPPSEGFSTTYFPGVQDLSTATQLNVPQGGVLQGIDLTLRKVRTYRVKGVAMLPSGFRGGGQVMLIKRDTSGQLSFSVNRLMSPFRAPAGEFEIRNVPPGSYIAQADHYDIPDIRSSGRTAIEVVDRDLENVTVTLGTGTEIQGSLKVEGPPTLNHESLTVYLEPRAGFMMSGNASARVKEGGSFTIAKAPQDHFSVRITGAPPEYYLKAIRAGDTDVLEQGLDLTQPSGNTTVEITLSPAAAQLEGAVVNSKGDPLPGAIILLRPTKSQPAMLPLLLKTVTSDQNGQFKLLGVTPGEYHLIAFEDVDMNEVQDPDLFEQHQSAATKLDLKENARESKQLKAVNTAEQTK